MASSQQQIHKWQEEMSSEEEKWILGSEELEETISSLKEMGRL